MHWKDWCLSWNSNPLATWLKKLTHWKRPWSWERLKAGEEGDGRGWDGWKASPTQWTWIWTNFRRWWKTGKPDLLQSMGSQRVRHDWATEQQQKVVFKKNLHLLSWTFSVFYHLFWRKPVAKSWRHSDALPVERLMRFPANSQWETEANKHVSELENRCHSSAVQLTHLPYWRQDSLLSGTEIQNKLVFVVQMLSHIQLFATPWTAAHQASLSFTVSRNLLKLMSIIQSSHSLLLLPSIFPSIRVFSSELTLHIR